jgi:hypothetical protein
MLDRELTPAERLEVIRDLIARRRDDFVRVRPISPKRRPLRGIPSLSFHVPQGPRCDTAPYTRNRP